MKRISIIHYAPIELYPPLQNIIRALESRSDIAVEIYSTAGHAASLSKFTTSANHIRLVRYGRSGHRLPAWRRLLNYTLYYLCSFVRLCIYRPHKVFFIETLSSFPAFLYKQFINRRSELYIHYHEYTSPREYFEGMKLNRIFHNYEKQLYPVANWVSHTNDFRMKKFLSDVTPVAVLNPKILPNYPPRQWKKLPSASIGKPIRFVYVGALSMSTMYTREFAEWVESQNGNVLWDIYSYNCTSETKSFFAGFNSKWTRLLPGTDYENLPHILQNYDAGVILYNGHIPNYIYNAPNKLFEYLACGLSVVFPSLMQGSLPYVKADTYPQVIAVDFTRLNHVNIIDQLDRTKKRFAEAEYFCEDAVEPLFRKLLA